MPGIIVLILSAIILVPSIEAAEIEFPLTSSSYPPLRIEGDAPAALPNGEPSPFRGFADPSIRSDPETGVLWMSYSWPHMHVKSDTRRFRLRRKPETSPGVSIHLARSDDGGAHWEYVHELVPSRPATNPVTGKGKGHISGEVSNLLPRETRQGVEWYAAWLEYFLPEKGGYKKRPPESFVIRIARAESPAGLASATTAALGSEKTTDRIALSVRLTDLAPELARYRLWNEPALAFEHGRLILALRGLAFTPRGAPDVRNSDIVVFSTSPRGPAHAWNWRYEGRLAGAEEARQLGGEGLTQIEFADARDGRLLALLTPDAWDPALEGFVHRGWRIVEVESLSPPRLARDASGRIKVRASMVAPDSSPLGPGASAYDPESDTGVLVVGRNKSRGEMTASIHATGFHP